MFAIKYRGVELLSGPYPAFIIIFHYVVFFGYNMVILCWIILVGFLHGLVQRQWKLVLLTVTKSLNGLLTWEWEDGSDGKASCRWECVEEPSRYETFRGILGCK